MSDAMTIEQVQERIVGLDGDTAKAVVCALIGHSKIQTTFFGYFYCGRCEAQVGDNLASAYDATKVVIVGHDCPTCRGNYASVTWRDTFLAPDPFAKPEDAQP